MTVSAKLLSDTMCPLFAIPIILDRSSRSRFDSKLKKNLDETVKYRFRLFLLSVIRQKMLLSKMNMYQEEKLAL
jgi:hypothetical protein